MDYPAVAATYQIREVQMSSDVEWEKYKRSVTQIGRCPAALVVPSKFTKVVKRPRCSSVLAPLFAIAMRRKQRSNLVSRIYSLSGNGARPISGGKFELRNRRRMY